MRKLMIYLALVSVVGALASPAGADARGTVKTIPVRSEYTEPAYETDGVGCHGLADLDPGPSTCQITVVGPTTLTGTMWGEVWYELDGYAGADGKIYYEGPDYVEGGVRGCGEGSYILDIYDGWVDMTKYDPATNTAPGFNRWRLRKGSGTGSLRNLVAGEGVNHWRVYFNHYLGLDPHFGRGVFTGTMACKAS